MTREEAQQLMSPRLHYLLCLMMSNWRSWRPQIGFKPCSAGFSTGGSVSSFEDLEDEGDRAAIDSLEVGWDELSKAEQILVEQCIGVVPWVFNGRPGVLEVAIEKLEKRVRI